MPAYSLSVDGVGIGGALCAGDVVGVFLAAGLDLLAREEVGRGQTEQVGVVARHQGELAAGQRVLRCHFDDLETEGDRSPQTAYPDRPGRDLMGLDRHREQRRLGHRG